MTQHEEKPTIAGIEVREDDVEPATGLHIAGAIFRVAALIIVVLAAWQAFDWFRDPPPGGAGLSVIIGDTIRLVVVAVTLYGGAALADLLVKNFQENRAARILLARQTYIMKQMGVASGDLPMRVAKGDRRGIEPGETVSPPPPDAGR